MFKKNFIIGAMLVITGLLFFIGCHPRPPFCKDNFGEKILKRMDNHVADLNLTDDQRRHYNNIRAEIKIDFANFQAERKKAHDEIQMELNLQNPDLKKITETIKKGHGKHPSKFENYSNKFLEFYNNLDDTQKSKVIEKLKDFSKRFNCD